MLLKVCAEKIAFVEVPWDEALDIAADVIDETERNWVTKRYLVAHTAGEVLVAFITQEPRSTAS